jgi:hypothetical protein
LGSSSSSSGSSRDSGGGGGGFGDGEGSGTDRVEDALGGFGFSDEMGSEPAGFGGFGDLDEALVSMDRFWWKGGEGGKGVVGKEVAAIEGKRITTTKKSDEKSRKERTRTISIEPLTKRKVGRSSMGYVRYR